MTPDLHSTYISFCSSENVCSPESTQQPIAVHGLAATHRYPHGRVEPPCRIRWSSQHVAQQTASYRSSEELWKSTLVHVIRITLEVPRRSGKASTLRRTLHTARRPEIVRHCSRAFALLGWMLSVAAIVLAFHVVATSARIRAPPRSPGDRSGVLEPPSPRSLFTHACRASCAAGQSALLFVIMLALTPASSTTAPCPRAPFATLVTSRRRVQDRRRREALSSQSLPVRRLHLGSFCPPRDQSSLRVPFASSSLAERIQPLRDWTSPHSDPRKQPP